VDDEKAANMTVEVVRRAKHLDIKRVRTLPFPGRVLVNEGQQVHPGDILAEAQVPAELAFVDVARGLGVAPRKANACLIRNFAEELEAGDVLAESQGVFTRVVRMPFNGLFLDFVDGRAVFSTSVDVTSLRAAMIGIVETVIPEVGAVLSTRGSLLQGVWGNGLLGEGVLRALIPESDEDDLSSLLDSVEPGQVIAPCWDLSAREIEFLLQRDISGLILYALKPDLISLVKSASVPVIILQGFGAISPDKQTTEILESRQGAIASIQACLPEKLTGERPEVIIPGGEGDAGMDLGSREKLAIGHLVQVNAGPEQGKTGKVIALPEEKLRCENGLTVFSAEVRLENSDTIIVPMTNLFILGG
jgi:hypothetical protein